MKEAVEHAAPLGEVLTVFDAQADAP